MRLKCLSILLLLLHISAACTIVSFVDSKGTTIAGNNEDSWATFLPVLHWEQKTDSTQGFYYVTYEGPEGDGNQFIQGGMNEAGLFFDWNAVPYSTYKNQYNTIPFSNIVHHLPLHILKYSKSVPEAFSLLKQYKLNGIETGQLHIADRAGNLGVVNADTMYLQKDALITTNFKANLTDKEHSCDRFTCAASLVKQGTLNLKKMTELCGATSQNGDFQTLYSSVQDLSTGAIRFYYLSDTTHSYKTSLKKLLAQGSGKQSIHTLFPKHPVVRLKSLIESDKTEEALKSLQEYPDSLQRLYSRFVSMALLVTNKDLKALPLLEFYRQKRDTLSLSESTVYCQSLFMAGEKDSACAILTKRLERNPDEMASRTFLRYMQKQFPANTNCTVSLKGYEDAPYVFVEGLGWNGPLLLHREKGGWASKFHLDPASYSYRFYVSGVGYVLDSSKHITCNTFGPRHVVRVKRKRWKEVTLSDAELKEYCGTYKISDQMDLTIYEKHGVLQSQVTGQEMFSIYPSAKDHFFTKAFESSITFQREESGRINALLFHQYDDIYCKRIK